MASTATQRAYQPEERPSRANRSGWSQSINSSLGMLDDMEEEQQTASVVRPVRPVPRLNQTGSLRAMPTPAPVPRQQQGTGLAGRLSGASDALGQAKPLIFLAAGAAVLLVAYLLISTAASFIGTKLDDMAYTTTRTTNLDAYVGHNETPGNPTHFTAQNIRGQIAVIEYPGGDPAKAMVITGPYLFGAGEDKAPVTLNVADINGDGKPDLLISAKGAQTAYINDGNSYRAMKPDERAAIEKAMSSAANAQTSTK
jgi:FG-GAP repeat protein